LAREQESCGAAQDANLEKTTSPASGARALTGDRRPLHWAGVLDAGHIGAELGIPRCTIFHVTYRAQDGRMVSVSEELSDAQK
jgi:hypothetical protein